MCGIAGILKTRGAVHSSEIIGMTGAMAHRGPDSWGYAYGDTTGKHETVVIQGDGDAPVDCNLALGHRRLSIIDLSSNGDQPMTYGHYTIVYNGELYNYIELARELALLGHAFVSHSDTEVLLHAWAEWGAGCLDKLNGIFAFLIWDALSRTLTAVRDRFGVKPLYYFADPDQTGFASEIKPLLTVRKGRPAPDEGLLYDFLVAGRMDHEDGTMFQGVRRLPGGCYMQIAGGEMAVCRYWRLDEGMRSGDLSFSEAAARFHDLFHESVRFQMRADVPVACCLSGGLDSSSVVSVASALSDYRMSVFTARFEDRSMDEWSWAEHIHRASPVDPVAVAAGPEPFWAELPALIKAQEEPIANPGIYAQWCVMKAIKERGIKVTLDGQGGDELLCGYAKFFYWSLHELLKNGRTLSALASALDGFLWGGSHLFNLSGARRYLPWSLGFKKNGLVLLNTKFVERQGSRTSKRGSGGIRAQQIMDVVTYSLPVLLRYEDKNSMAHSIEARVPFLDHRLVEYCISLPTDMKIKGSWSKRVLREGLVRDVPQKILQRRSKLGFGGSYKSWVHALQPQLQAFVGDESRPVFKVVNPEACREFVMEENPMIFRIAALDAWLTEFNISA
jgi:asparagine synthase (glutamine-hydrolysing)